MGTYSWLHKLRNTQGNIYGTYLGKTKRIYIYIYGIYVYIYGIYKEYIRNIHKHLWSKIIRNADPMGRPPKACFWLFYIINVYVYSLYIPYIFHRYFLDMFHLFSLVCFLFYGVKSESGHDGSQNFGPIWHVSGPEMVFWRNL